MALPQWPTGPIKVKDRVLQMAHKRVGRPRRTADQENSDLRRKLHGNIFESLDAGNQDLRARVPEVDGMTYAWEIKGGTIITGSTASSMMFHAGYGPNLNLRCRIICPAQGCGRRVAILPGGSIFACRHCYRLAYPSQRENPDDRAARRADKIRARLGWESGIINPDGEKPKGMHWRTLLRLKAEHDRQVAVSLEGMMARMELIHERVQKYCDDHLDEPDNLFRDLG